MNRCCFHPLLHALLATLLLCSLAVTADELFGDLGTSIPAPANQLLSSASAAAPEHTRETGREAVQEPTAETPNPGINPSINLSPADAARLARNHTGGQVMSVSTDHNAGRVIYGVKVLTAGRMRIVNIDAVNGEILNP